MTLCVPNTAHMRLVRAAGALLLVMAVSAMFAGVGVRGRTRRCPCPPRPGGESGFPAWCPRAWER